MNAISKLIIILSASCLSLSAFTQVDVPFKKSYFPEDPTGLSEAKKRIKEGNEKIKYYNDFHGAIDSYLKAWEFNPDNSELNYKIGDAYFHTYQKSSALNYFEKAATLNDAIENDLYFKLGKARQLNYQFDDAINAFNIHLQNNPKLSKDEAKALQKHITECRYGLELVKDTLPVEIVNLGAAVNTEYAEYNPMIVSDGSRILFTARRKYTGNPIEPKDNKPCEDVWYADKDEEGNWIESKKFSSIINTRGHDGISGISPDGQQLFICKAVNEFGGDLFVSDQRGDKWTKPKLLQGEVNTEMHESKISLTFDGKTMYFVSSREEGSMGGRDIWVSHKNKSGIWAEPENLGPVINTEFYEEGVFIHPDGRTLYFCSQGHNSMGGYDIFRSKKDADGNWSAPENLGYPINTPDDEAFWALTSDGRHAFISSVRPEGFGDYDIYEVIFPELEDDIEKVQQIDVQLTLFTGFVKDINTLEPLKASIEIVDNGSGDLVTELSSNEATGKFLVNLPAGTNYGLSVSCEDYMFHSENFNVEENAGFLQINKEILLQPMEVGTRIVLHNIFFDYNQATLRKESFGELEKVKRVMEDNPDMIIEISGHTDNKGSEDYNTTLSSSRAKAVVDYLVEQGIDAERMQFKGYAFSQPIADNDTDEGRQMNRRVEFKVISND